MVSNTSHPLLAGVGRNEIGTLRPGKLHDPLYARALVLSYGPTRVAVIAMDAVAIGGICDLSDDFLPRLRERLQAQLGIPARHILVNASHTHTAGPMLRAEADVLEQTFQAVAQAASQLTPVIFGAGSGSEERIVTNRTLRLKNGRAWTIRHTNPSPPDDDVAGLGPVDPEIGVFRFDRLDGRPLAVLFNYACHPLIGVPDGRVTAGFPGFACRTIEDILGQGVQAMFLQGAGGDIIEMLNKDFTGPRSSEPVGVALALSTIRAWRQITPGQADVDVAAATVRFPRRQDIPERVAELRREQQELLDSLRYTSLNLKSFIPAYLASRLDPEHPSADAYRYLREKDLHLNGLTELDRLNRKNLDKYIANVRAMEKLARIQDRIATYFRHLDINDQSGETSIEAEVLGLRIGDAALISCPAEALTEIGLSVKKQSPLAKTYMAAYSNGYMHYGAPAKDYPAGGYEVTECFLAPEWERIYLDTAQKVLAALSHQDNP